MANNSNHGTNWRLALLERHRWLVFLLPFLVFMLLGALEPTPSEPGGKAIGLAIPYMFYPWLYTIKIAATLAAVAFVLPGYREFPPRVTLLGIVVGVIGGPLWIGICSLQIEHTYLLPLLEKLHAGWIIDSGVRAAYNPFEQLADQPLWAWSFLAVRFLGLVAVLPLIEEFFLRGFVMRFVVDAQWWDVPFGKVNRLAIVLGTAVPMMMHPGELLAALLWFSMITWLMLKTRNIWDCVIAHAATNLILGVYVVWAGGEAWQLM